MATKDSMDISAELIPAATQGKIRDSLKKALKDQLQKEAATLGPLAGGSAARMTIHGKQGVSNRQ